MRIPTDNPLTLVQATVPGIAHAQATQIARATLRAFNATTYEATVQLSGSAATYLTGIPTAANIPIGLLRAGARCVIAFFNPADPTDACLIAVYGRPPYRDDPGNYLTLDRSLLNAAALVGSSLFYLNRDYLTQGVLG